MRRRLPFLLLALALAVTTPRSGAVAQGAAPAAGGLYARSYAVVVGIGRYPSPKWPDLRYARRDAAGMAALLRERGFEVIELTDAKATRQAILSTLEDYLAPRLGRDDRVLFFFSGHGHTRTLGGSDYGYIVPHDGGDSLASLISMEALRSLAAKMGAARHQLFIMDACFGGQFAPTKAAAPGVFRNHPNYIREVTRRIARQYLTAGGKNQQVLDGGPEGYSYFTGYLVRALRDGLGDLDGDGYITMAELSTFLVPRATNAFQTPGAGTLPGHELGEFVFLAPAALRSAARPRPPGDDTAGLGIKGVDREVVFWRSVRDSGDAADFAAYLRAFPDGAYAAEARRRRAALGAAPATPPRAGETAPPATAPGAATRSAALAPAPPDTGRRIDRVFADSPGEVRNALASFLRNRHSIPDAAFGVDTIWSHRVVGTEPRGQVVEIRYEVQLDRRDRDVRDDRFVLQVENGTVRVVDQLTPW
jgi:uncharacterized caspase-like protein